MEFPKVKHECGWCSGTGKEDVSYHGSPVYADCQLCKGEVGVEYFRKMRIEEKLDFLLKEIERLHHE